MLKNLNQYDNLLKSVEIKRIHLISRKLFA